MSHNSKFDLEQSMQIDKPQVRIRIPWHRRYKLAEILLIASMGYFSGNTLYQNREKICSEVKNTTSAVVEYFDLLKKEKQKTREKQKEIGRLDSQLSNQKGEYEQKIEGIEKENQGKINTLKEEYATGLDAQRNYNLNEINKVKIRSKNTLAAIEKGYEKILADLETRSDKLLNGLERDISEKNEEIRDYQQDIKKCRTDIAELTRKNNLLGRYAKSLEGELARMTPKKVNPFDEDVSRDIFAPKPSRNSNSRDFSIVNYCSIGKQEWVLTRESGSEKLLYKSRDEDWQVQWKNNSGSAALAVLFEDGQEGRIIAKDCSFRTFDGGKEWIKDSVYFVGNTSLSADISVRKFSILGENRWQITYDVGGFSHDAHTKKIECYETNDGGKSWKLIGLLH